MDLVTYWLDFPKAADTNIKTRVAVPEIKDANGKPQKVTAGNVFTLSCRFGDTLFCASNSGQGFDYKGLSLEIHSAEGFLIFDEERGLQGSFEFGKTEPITADFSEVNLKGGIFKVGVKHFTPNYLNYCLAVNLKPPTPDSAR